MSDNELKSFDSIIEEAKAFFDLVSEAEFEIRQESVKDSEFAAGKQWEDGIKTQRDIDRRPCLTINRLPQFIRQVTNDQRQNRPSIQVNPVDDNADVDTAEILQGLIRHIEYDSHADVAYDRAFDSAVRGGFGYFRIITEYCDPQSFEQDIKIKSIRNPLNVYLDPAAKEADRSDGNFALIVEEISKSAFMAQYPESKLSQMTNWEAQPNRSGWVNKGSCRIAEVFKREYKREKIVLLGDGTVTKKSDVAEFLGRDPVKGQDFVDERMASIPSIKWFKINDIEILEQTDWLGQWIPIIPVFGEELEINGKLILEGIVRHAKDPQRMKNYWQSAATETIALAPRAPFIGAEGQFDGHKTEWQQANVRNQAFLQYKPQSVNGVLAPPPQRQVYEPPIQAIYQSMLQSDEDLKATTGIYDAALGARSNENSGIAIQRRNQQSQTSNFHFVDNLTRAIRHGGRIIVDLIPHIYDTPRAVRIIGAEGDHRVVKINQVVDGEKGVYFSNGKYDVTVSVGPSYQTKRQEAVESMLSLSQSYPQLPQVAGDLLVKNMDWPGAKEISERIKKTLPPGIADSDDKQQPIPPEIQSQMQQMGAFIQQLQDQLAQLNDQLKNKRLELESRERIEMKKLEVQLEIKKAELDQKDALAILQSEIDQINQQIQMNQEIVTPMESESFQYQPSPGGDSPATGLEPTEYQ